MGHAGDYNFHGSTTVTFKALSFALLCAWSALPTVPARGAQTGLTGRQACVFTIANLSSSTRFDEYQKIMTDALVRELENAGLVVIPADALEAARAERGFSEGDLASWPNALEVARSLKGHAPEVAFTGAFLPDGEKALLTLDCIDVTSGTLFGVQRSLRFNLTLYTTLREAIAELLSRSRVETRQTLGQAIRNTGLPEIVFAFPAAGRTMEGMEISIAGGEPIGRVAGGELSFTPLGIREGTPLEILKTKEGYHPEQEKVKAAPRVILKPLVKATSSSLEVSAQISGPVKGGGLGWRGYLVPDRLFWRIRESLYAQPPATADASWVLYDEVLAGIGGYPFSKPDALFRIGIGTGAGLRTTSFIASGSGPAVDMYWNILELWLDLNTPLFTVTILRSGIFFGLPLPGSVLAWGSPWQTGEIFPLSVGLTWKL